MSKKLQASLKKIDSVFERMFRHKITVKGKKNINEEYEDRIGMSVNTRNTYTDMMKSLMRDLHKEYGVADITRVKKEQVNQLIEKRMNSYHDGELNQAYNLKTLVAAVNSFNFGVEHTKIFKRKFEVGDVQEIRKKMKDEKIIRKTSSSQNLKATKDESEEVLKYLKDGGHYTRMRDLAEKVGRISMLTGGRITAILKLRVEDIQRLPSGDGLITFNKDKGGLTRTVRIDFKTLDYFDGLMVGKSSKDRLFSPKNANGTFKSVYETRKVINHIVSGLSKFLSRDEEVVLKDKNGYEKSVWVEKKFSFHSFRKSFADTKVKYYFDLLKDKKTTEEMILKLEKNNPKVREKLKTQLERINKNRNTDRTMTREELSIFMSSVDLGHFRNDVIVQYYIDIKSFREYQKTVL